MRTKIACIGLLVMAMGLSIVNSADLARPKPPDFLSDPSKIKAWVIQTIIDSPPKGEGEVNILRLYPLHYGPPTDKWPKGVWGQLTICKITMDGRSGYGLFGVTYDIDNRESSLFITIPIDEEDLQKYLNAPEPNGDDMNSKYNDVTTIITI